MAWTTKAFDPLRRLVHGLLEVSVELLEEDAAQRVAHAEALLRASQLQHTLRMPEDGDEHK